MKALTKVQLKRADEYAHTRGVSSLAELLVRLEDKERGAWVRGAEAAAGVAAEYDAHSDLPTLASDRIRCKLNLPGAPKAPRKNKHAQAAFLRGFALALAEINRLFDQPGHVYDVMRAAGVTVKEMRGVGVEEFDLDEVAKCMKSEKRPKRRRA